MGLHVHDLLSGLLLIPSDSIRAISSAASISLKLIEMKLIIVISTLALCALSTVSLLPISDIRLLQSTIDGHIQEDVNHNSSSNDEDWLTNALDGIASFVVSKLSDPNNIEEERKYLKVARLFIESVVEYHDKAKPNDKVANKILHGIKSFLTLLGDKVSNHPGNNISQLAFAS